MEILEMFAYSFWFKFRGKSYKKLYNNNCKKNRFDVFVKTTFESSD